MQMPSIELQFLAKPDEIPQCTHTYIISIAQFQFASTEQYEFVLSF